MNGDKENLTFAGTHYTQIVKYKSSSSKVLGDQPKHNKNKKKDTVRYFQKKIRSQLLENPSMCRPIEEIETEEDILKKSYIPTELSYAETLKVREHQTEAKKSAYDKSGFYLDSVDVNGKTGQVKGANETMYEFYMKQSKSFNEKLAKDSKNDNLWLEFVKFQDDAFPHLFSDISDKNSKSNHASKKSVKALAERKIALLDTGIKKNPHSVKLQMERLRVGEELWEHQQLKKEWATLVYNFPNNMSVWHR